MAALFPKVWKQALVFFISLDERIIIQLEVNEPHLAQIC